MKRTFAATSFAAITALLVVLALGSAVSAAPSRRITLHVGDVFVVAGTHVACQTQVGKHVIRGKKLVTCFKLKGNGLAAKSYIAALGENGRLVVARINSHGAPGVVVFDRTASAVGAHAKQFTVHAGDEMKLSGTDIGCAINNDSSGIYPTCFRHTSTGGRPHSYAFAVTDRFCAVVQFNAKGTKTKLVFKRLHGH
jgi:hypothetical protein